MFQPTQGLQAKTNIVFIFRMNVSCIINQVGYTACLHYYVAMLLPVVRGSGWPVLVVPYVKGRNLYINKKEDFIPCFSPGIIIVVNSLL